MWRSTFLTRQPTTENVFKRDSLLRLRNFETYSNSLNLKRNFCLPHQTNFSSSKTFLRNFSPFSHIFAGFQNRTFSTIFEEKLVSNNPETIVNLDTSSVDFKEKLRSAQEDADRFPDNTKMQADYLKLLNLVDAHAVLRRMRGPYSINEACRKEFVKAMVKTGDFDQFPIDTLFKGDKTQQQGNNAKNPVFVTMTSSWGSVVYTIAMVILGGVLIYSLFFRGGGLGEGMLGKQPMHTPVEKSNTSFKDVMGADEAKQELQDIVEYLKNPGKFSRLGAKLPKGVLLVGPPGCGKTLVARALAGEAGVPFFFASGAEFEEMFVGVGASRVRKLFDKAKQMAPCVIFLDEIDAIGGKRDSPDARYHKMTLNQLLVELDGFEQHAGVIVVAATNLPDVLDPAITRPGRFDRTVMIDLPDVKARKDIIKLYLSGRAAPDVNVESLAKSTTGFSGAELFNMVNIAAIDATKKNLTKIPMYLIESAKDHVMMGPERKAMVITPSTKKLTAFHEAGHALVGLYSPCGENEIVKATLVPRGHALGMVAWQPKEELLSSKEAYMARLDTAMGGRVAEELVFGPEKVTPGAGSDFQQATNIARAMVTQFGMSEKLGKMAFSDNDIKYNRVSETTQHMIEQEVREILDKAYNRAKIVLSKHRNELDLLASALVEYETLSLEEIKLVIEGKDLKTFMQKKKQEELELIAKEEELYGIPQISSEELDLKQMIKERTGELEGKPV